MAAVNFEKTCRKIVGAGANYWYERIYKEIYLTMK